MEITAYIITELEMTIRRYQEVDFGSFGLHFTKTLKEAEEVMDMWNESNPVKGYSVFKVLVPIDVVLNVMSSALHGGFYSHKYLVLDRYRYSSCKSEKIWSF